MTDKNPLPFPTNKDKLLEDAIRDFGREYDRDEELLSRFIDLLNQGCDEAYFYIGCLYEDNGGDLEKALFYYHKSIEEIGSIEGYLALGRMYFYGVGTEIDYKKSYDYFLRVYTESKNSIAAMMLGKFYLNGLYVEKNLNLAKEYLEYAVSNGFVWSLKELSILEKIEGHYFRSLLLNIRANVKYFFIAKKDAGDIRLRSG